MATLPTRRLGWEKGCRPETDHPALWYGRDSVQLCLPPPQKLTRQLQFQSTESAQSTEDVYSLQPITLPSETESAHQLVDIIVIHDFDEKSSANWGYMDLKKIVQLGKRKELGVVDDLDKPQDRRSHESGRQSAANPSKPGSGTEETAVALADNNKGELTAERHDGASHSANDGTPSKPPSRTPSFIEPVPSRYWLQDPDMLPKALPGARVLAFTYPTRNLRRLNDDKDVSMLDNFIEKAASALLERVLGTNTKVGELPPIVFVAAGLGGIIVQMALKMVLKKVEQASSAQVSKVDLSEPANLADMPTESMAPALDIHRIADVILLDTPFPKDCRALKNFPPMTAPCARATVIAKLMRKLEAGWNSEGIDGIWAQCWDALSRQEQAVRFAWLYSREPSNAATGAATNRPPVITNTWSGDNSSSSAPTLIRILLDRVRRLSNFDGPDDPGYKSVIIHMRESLTLKAASDPNLKYLLKMLLETGTPVNTKDETGVSILHLAAVAPNPDAVNWLLSRHADTRVRNSRSQTPLHCAIEMFCDRARCPNDDVALQYRLKTVIEDLLNYTQKSELHNSRDELGRTPRDLVRKCRCRAGPETLCRHDQVKDLLDGHRPTIKGGREEESEKPWRCWDQPQRGTSQHKACVRSKASVAAFYSKTAEGPPLGDYEVPSVYDLIYKPHGPAGILSKIVERFSPSTTAEPPACRWIHLPANNVRPSQSSPLRNWREANKLNFVGTMGSRMVDHALLVC